MVGGRRVAGPGGSFELIVDSMKRIEFLVAGIFLPRYSGFLMDEKGCSASVGPISEVFLRFSILTIFCQEIWMFSKVMKGG